MPHLVAELRKSMYVDDLMSEKPTVPEAKKMKEVAIRIFEDAKLTLHKWHSNVADLEESERGVEDEGTFAKQQLGQTKAKTGLLLDKQEDQISVTMPQYDAVASKGTLLRNLARIYDPLGLVEPVTIKGKFFYRDVCNVKMAGDAPLPRPLTSQWIRWKKELPAEVMVTRALTCAQEQIERIELHAFGDASKNGVCARSWETAIRGKPGFGYCKGSTSEAGADHSAIRAVVGTYSNKPYHKRRVEGFPVNGAMDGWIAQWLSIG